MSDYHQIVFPRKLLKKFILMYKELRCLWDREDIGYRIKNKKHAALSQLTELVQQYDPNATRVHVLRKIESLRSCVRREYKKIQDSRQFANCEDDVHKPNLWYYDLLSFVFDSHGEKTTTAVEVLKSGSEEEDEDIDEPIDNDHHESFETESYQSEYNIMNVVEVDRPSTSIKHSSGDDTYKIKRARSATEVDDEYDAIGINVAAKLRHLPANMRILAEKLINDVLFQAQTNALNSSTTIVTSDPFKNETSSTTH